MHRPGEDVALGVGVVLELVDELALHRVVVALQALEVDAGVEYAKTGKKVSGYTDTGVTLVSDKPMAGVESKDTKFGLDSCWGAK